MDILRYSVAERNQLANCMLLTAQENGAGGKGDTPPGVWFADKAPQYLARHLIPADPSLWELDRFEDFLTERKTLILDKMRTLKLIAPETPSTAPVTEMPTATPKAGFTTIHPAE